MGHYAIIVLADALLNGNHQILWPDWADGSTLLKALGSIDVHYLPCTAYCEFWLRL